MATTAKPYDGSNARLNAILQSFPDDKVFMVNGYNGRVPVVADNEAHAKEIYEKRPSKWEKSQ